MTACDLQPITAVLGHRSDELRALLPPGVGSVLNERYREGKSTSIVAGIASLPPEAEAVLVVAVDQPCARSVLGALIDRFRQESAPILLPSTNMRRGHPSLFSRAVFPELLAITEEREGLREVMARHNDAIRYVEVDSDLVRVNLNSPEDYERAFAIYGSA
jgi:molybdenum cofactor cytidylyltransferase